MNPNSLDLGLAIGLFCALTAWTINRRHMRSAIRQRDTAHRIATEKGQRLLAALDERDAARRHADDAQLLLNSLTGRREGPVVVHPSLRSVK